MGTGSLIAIDVPFFDSNCYKNIRSHLCFFILTCAHNVVYRKNFTDKNYIMADEITIFLGKNKNPNFKESVNEEYTL